MTSQNGRDIARMIFERALAASTVAAAVRRSVWKEDRTLHIRETVYDLRPFRNIFLIALGKASAPLFDTVRPLLPPDLPVRSIVSASSPPHQLGPGDLYFAGGHPQPTADSEQAARAALRLLNEASETTLVIFLMSGGASAMCELPVDGSISFDDLVAVHRLLVASGAPIAKMNTVRKHLSAVKGGRLAQACGSAASLSLLVSDVAADAIDALGSGPSLPDSSTVSDCLGVIRAYNLEPSLPPSVRALLEHRLPETPKPGDAIFLNKQSFVLLDNSFLLDRAAEVANELGFPAVIDNTCDDWDYDDAAKFLVRRARDLSERHSKLCLLSGGEVTVSLPPRHGTGGRNQQFALECAVHHDLTGLTLLSGGSDGIDGNSKAAGAVADGSTLTRARENGLSPEASLRSYDADPFFSVLRDDIVTGPTANNLRDLRILLWNEDATNRD